MNEYRRRHWKRDLKRQQSEARLYRRLESMHARDDPRMVVLAYSAWGATDAPSGVKKGNAPTIGVSMMRKLGKRFLVSPTPEHFTSKTCCKCLAPCGSWKEVETKMGHSIRGLRICQDETCKLPEKSGSYRGAQHLGAVQAPLRGQATGRGAWSPSDLRRTLCVPASVRMAVRPSSHSGDDGRGARVPPSQPRVCRLRF